MKSRVLPKLKDAFKENATEAEIKASIRSYLSRIGIFSWPEWQGQFSFKGIPDIIGVIPGSGRILGIEVKLPSWKPPLPGTKRFVHYQEQREFIETINGANGVAFFATSVDDVIRELQIKGLARKETLWIPKSPKNRN